MYVDSPFEICRKRGCYVLLDQTLQECAAEHQCKGSPEECPLRGYFTGTRFDTTQTPESGSKGGGGGASA